jgi:hypothetical protein
MTAIATSAAVTTGFGYKVSSVKATTTVTTGATALSMTLAGAAVMSVLF